MTYKRNIKPLSLKIGMDLTPDLIGIGFRLVGKPNPEANIENTLISASLEGLVRKDGRVLSLLTDWLEIHHNRINADRLIQLILDEEHESKRMFLVYWCAVFQWLKSDFRFLKLQKLYPASIRIPYLGDRTDFLVQRHGEDARFSKTCLIVPNKVLRHRLEDIMSPSELVKLNLMYRYRVMIGSTYRADMWAKLHNHPDWSASDIARDCYGSYPTAHAVKKDFQLMKS